MGIGLQRAFSGHTTGNMFLPNEKLRHFPTIIQSLSVLRSPSNTKGAYLTTETGRLAEARVLASFK